MKSKADWYLEDVTHANWPNVKGWRGRDQAKKGRGYRSEDEASERVHEISRAYNAKYGTGGPDLRVRRVEVEPAASTRKRATPLKRQPTKKAKAAGRLVVRLAVVPNPDHGQYGSMGVPTRRVPVTSLEHASHVVRAFVRWMTEEGLGGGNWGGGEVHEGKRLVARVSYNGRVWPPEGWTSGQVPLYDPPLSSGPGGAWDANRSAATPAISLRRAREVMANTNALPRARVVWPDGSDWSDEIDHRTAWAWVAAPDEVELFGGVVEVAAEGMPWTQVSSVRP